MEIVLVYHRESQESRNDSIKNCPKPKYVNTLSDERCCQDCARVTGSRNNYYRTRIGISRSKYLLERPSVSLRIGLAVAATEAAELELLAPMAA